MLPFFHSAENGAVKAELDVSLSSSEPSTGDSGNNKKRRRTTRKASNSKKPSTRLENVDGDKTEKEPVTDESPLPSSDPSEKILKRKRIG